MAKNKKDNSFLVQIAQLLRLETMTTAGRVNLGALIILVIFVIAYTANDTICYFVSAVRDAYKTTILQTDVSNPYETISVFKLLIPIILLIIFCLGFLYINEKAKNKVSASDKEKEGKR